MTEIEELVMLILPELKTFIKSESIDQFVQKELDNKENPSIVTLANGSAYAVEGEALDRFGMEFGAGVTAEVNDNIELSLGYEGKFRQDCQDHTGLLNVKYKF